MAATASDRNTKARPGQRRAFGMAANTYIPSGVIVCLNAAGNLVNGSTSATLVCVGVSVARYDNSTGAAGAIKGEADRGVWGPFANSAAADQVALADIGNDCFIVDNQTVAKTNGGATRSVAGKVHDVTPEGVWVHFTK